MSTNKKAKHYHRSRTNLVRPAEFIITRYKRKESEENSKSVANQASTNFQINIAPKPPQIRKDYFTEDLVLIASKRHARPTDITGFHKRHDVLFETSSNPRLDLMPTIYSLKDAAGNWLVKVIQNMYPSLSLDNPEAYGKQEIIIDTPLANRQLASLGIEQIVNLFQVYQHRIRVLGKLPEIKYVLVFKNDGSLAGASLAHSHSQVFALPFVPGAIGQNAAAIEHYYQKNQSDPYDSIIDFELAENQRVIEDAPDFISICPYASSWPLEAWIISKQDIKSIADFSTAELVKLAKILKNIIARLSRYNISYNFYLENATGKHQRFVLKIEPRSLNVWGGFEVATNITINTIPPEDAAKWYKN